MDRISSSPFSADCRWVWLPGRRAGEDGFVLFRRRFRTERDGVLQLVFSADHRAVLFCDGVVVARAPVRGDLEHYHCERLELALPAGEHVLAAEIVVWGRNFRQDPAPWSEIHDGGGWVVDGGVCDGSERLVDLSTPGAWRCVANPAHRNRLWSAATRFPGTFPAPPMEEVEFREAHSGWQWPEFDDAAWQTPVTLGRVYWRDDLTDDNDTRWWLVERRIPALVEVPHPILRVIRAANGHLELDAAGVLSGRCAAGTTRFLLDLGDYHTGFGQLHWECDGAGEIELDWAEALYFDGEKRQRDDDGGAVDGYGLRDRLSFPAGVWRWSPFTYRSGRFVEVTVTADAPVRILEFSVTDWHYPFERLGRVQAPELPELDGIAAMCWNTVLCCAHEHYEDCPYWEQLQYLGDTRIQAAISYAVTGDDRLGRQAIRQFGQSILPEGLTQSRYPSNWRQVIPGFSLCWILMLDDHYQYYDDAAFLAEWTPLARRVLEYCEARQRPDGLIGALGYWDITDWASGWEPAGRIDRGSGEPATLISLQYAYCCRIMARFDPAAGYEERARRTIAAVNAHCRDSAAGLYCDVPHRPWFSQHTNAWALLAGAVTPEEAPALLRRLFEDDTLVQTTLYFTSYLFEVIRQYRCDGRFLAELGRWRQMREWGFKTCPEIPELNTRSDCHAWGASPLSEMVTGLLGVTPAEPGFARVRVAPLPGHLTHLSGVAPLGARRGTLAVELRRVGAEWELTLLSSVDIAAELHFPDGGAATVQLTAGVSRRTLSRGSKLTGTAVADGV